MKNILRAWFIAGTVMLISCEKDESNFLADDYFPNRTGFSWTYYRYDSIAAQQDTLVVSITGSTSHTNGERLKIWQFTGKNVDEKQYISRVGDTVKFYLSTDGRISQILLIPFHEYDKWTNPHEKLDTTYVRSLVDVEINNTVYKDSYELNRHVSKPGSSLKETLMYKPRLGLVMLSRLHQLNEPAKNEIWLLISHRFN